jgi:hypothetical protein
MRPVNSEKWQIQPGSRASPICTCGLNTTYYLKDLGEKKLVYRLCSRCDASLIDHLGSQGWQRFILVPSTRKPFDSKGYDPDKVGPLGDKKTCKGCRHFEENVGKCLVTGKRVSANWKHACRQFGRKGL